MGVFYIFFNFGSDHLALIKSLAQAQKENKKLSKLIICPHDMVAMSAAHGYAQITGEPQAVIVHVECGTKNIGRPFIKHSKEGCVFWYLPVPPLILKKMN